VCQANVGNGKSLGDPKVAKAIGDSVNIGETRNGGSFKDRKRR